MPTLLAPPTALATSEADEADAGTSDYARRAAALAYEAGDARTGRAPRVSAKGSGFLAEEIIARARAAGVPIHESRELVSLLMQPRCWPGSTASSSAARPNRMTEPTL